MGTSAIAGYKGVMAASTSTAGSFSEIAEVRNFNITVEMAEVDATSHDSSGDREVIAGTNSWSATADYIQVMASTDHQAIYDVMVARTRILAEWYPTGSSSDGYYTGTGFFNSWELASPNDDALTATVGFGGSGALTRSASSS